MKILRAMSLGVLAGCFFMQSAVAGEWIADANGCKVWNQYPKPGESVSWSGACDNGIANGNGVMQWFKDGQLGSKYEGYLVDGKRAGKGVVFWKDGNRYEGDFVDGKLAGKGFYVTQNGNRYEVNSAKGVSAKGVDSLSNEGLLPNGMWIADKKSGCKTLFPFGALTDGLIETRLDLKTWSDPNVSVVDAKWNGKCANGIAFGKGALIVVFKLYTGNTSYLHEFNTFRLSGEVTNGIFNGEVEVASKWRNSMTIITPIVVLDGKALSVREYIKKTDPAKYKAILAKEEAERERYREQSARETEARERKTQGNEVFASSSISYCSASDTCFETISTRGDEVTIKCTKGINIGRTKIIRGPNANGKWAYSSGGYHRRFREAGNFACEY